jgi:hypothetical protein
MNGSQRPYKALFGGSAADPDVHHTLDLSGSVLSGYDDNVVGAGSGDAPLSPFNTTGFYSGYSGMLSYSWNSKDVQIGATAGTDGRYYADLSKFVGVNTYGGIGMFASLGERTRISLNQSVSYSPAYLYGLFPPLASSIPGNVVGIGDPLGDEHMMVYDTTGTVTRNISRHGSLEAEGSYRVSDYSQSMALSKGLKSYSIGGRYRHTLTRYASLRLGYAYRRGSYTFQSDLSRPTTIHDIDVGLDYRRPLSLTRRTTLDFAVGTSIVSTPLAGDANTELQYHVLGDVGLTHQMGRTWSTRIAYSRGVDFAAGFAQPILSDAVNASLAGFFSRRLDFDATGGLSIGNSGFSEGPASQNFKAYNASARLRYALGSSWALFGEYTYYRHDLGTVLIVAEGVPPNLDRNSIQGGVTLWLPLYRR